MEKEFIPVGEKMAYRDGGNTIRPSEGTGNTVSISSIVGQELTMSERTDDGEYLVVVDYEDERERKRAEYLLDNWEDGSVDSVRGMSRIIQNVDIDELYDQLAAKVPEEALSMYKLSRIDTEATRVQETIDETFDGVDMERVEWAMESLMKKRKAVDQGATTDDESLWAVYTKKGRAEIKYDIRQQDNNTVALHVTIDGFGEAPEFLREFIEEEISYMIT